MNLLHVYERILDFFLQLKHTPNPIQIHNIFYNFPFLYFAFQLKKHFLKYSFDIVPDYFAIFHLLDIDLK